MTTDSRPTPPTPVPNQPAKAAVPLAARLQGYATLLAGRVAALQTRTDPTAAPVVAELATAVEQLQLAEVALRVQGDDGAATTAALAEAQQELRAVCDLLPDAYVVTDAAGVIQQASAATSALVGYARSYVIGKPLTALLDRRTQATFPTRLAAFCQTPPTQPQTWALVLRPRHDGPPVQAQVRVAPITDAAGTVTGVRWLLRDVTVQRATAAALARLQAEQAQQLRTRTMELEAVVRMQAETRAIDQAALAQLVHDSIQALQHGAEPSALLVHVLRTLHDHFAGQARPAVADPAD